MMDEWLQQFKRELRRRLSGIPSLGFELDQDEDGWLVRAWKNDDKSLADRLEFSRVEGGVFAIDAIRFVQEAEPVETAATVAEELERRLCG